MSASVVRLTSPGDIVRAVPHLCGFVPGESLVAVSLRGQRRRIGLTLRLDLPFCEDAVAAREVALRLAHDGASAVLLVVFTEGESRDRLVDALTEAVEERGLEVLEALLVRAGRWTSYRCRSSCCPVDGTPVDGPPDVLAARSAYDGRAVLRDRTELVASLAAPQLLAARSIEQQLDEALIRWIAEVESRGREAICREAVRAFRDGLLLEGLPDVEVPALVVALQDVLVRDEVGTLALDDSDALLALLLHLGRQSVRPYDVPVCTLVALVAWVRGDGALANVALDRALAGDPSYGMANLLRAGLDGQLPPTAVREWLRETRQAMRAARRAA